MSADPGTSRWMTRWTPSVPVGLIVVLVLVSTAGSAQVPQTATVKIGFGQTLPDRQIVDLLDGYPGVEVTAARLLIGEYKVTHRSGDGMPVERFLPEARAEVADHFRKGAEADLYRFRRFVEKYDAAQVEADPDLADEARGDLKLARRWAVGASLPSNGEPVIFALEISGERAALEQVVEDQRVRAHWFVGRGLFGAGGEPFRAPTTEPTRSDPEIDSLSGAEAYERMQEAVRRGRIEADGGG